MALMCNAKVALNVRARTAQEVIEKYYECKLEKNKDSEEWITQIDKIQLCLQIDYGKFDYEDDHFKAAVVHILIEPYHLEKILLKDKYKVIDLQDMILIL